MCDNLVCVTYAQRNVSAVIAISQSDSEQCKAVEKYSANLDCIKYSPHDY